MIGKRKLRRSEFTGLVLIDLRCDVKIACASLGIQKGDHTWRTLAAAKLACKS